jgi:hypothetical protein
LGLQDGLTGKPSVKKWKCDCYKTGSRFCGAGSEAGRVLDARRQLIIVRMDFLETE